MSELPFNIPRGHAAPGDDLGRVFTPAPLALAICERLAADGVNPGFVTEGSVGPGSYVRAVRQVWPSAHITAVDIDPAAEGLALADESVVTDWCVAMHWDTDDLNIGNPPFPDWRTARKHIEFSVARSRMTVLTLPLPYLGQGWFNDLAPIAEVWPLLDRPWPRVREIAAFVWHDVPQIERARGIGLVRNAVVRPLRWK